MSAAPRYPAGTGYAGLRMTADEYLALGETPERYELIDGVVVMSPSPVPLHNEVALEIAFQLKRFAQEHDGVRIFPETDLRLTGGTVYRPDITVYRAGRLRPGPGGLDLPPDLLVEVLSPGTKALDLIQKREDFDRFGVAEYWVIDPVDARVRRWTRQGVKLVEALGQSERVESSGLPGFALELRPIRQLIERARS